VPTPNRHARSRPAIDENLEYLMTAFLEHATAQEKHALATALQRWEQTEDAFPLCLVGSAIAGLAAGLPETSTIAKTAASIGYCFWRLHNLRLADHGR